MKTSKSIIFAALVSLTLALMIGRGAGAEQLWKRSMVVGKFPQRTAQVYQSAGLLPGNDVRAISVCGGTVYFGAGRGIAIFDGKKWAALDNIGGKLTADVTRIFCNGGKDDLLVGTKAGLFEVKDGNVSGKALLGQPITAISRGKSGIVVGTTSGLFVVEGGDAKRMDALDRKMINDAVVDSDGTIWAGLDTGLAKIDSDGKTVTYFHKAESGEKGLLDDNVRSLYLAAGGTLWIGTPVGLSIFDRRGVWDYVTGKHGGLPYEDVLTVAGGGGILWVGTNIGACRYDGKEWAYFQGPQYLADDRVESVSVAPEGIAWLGTPAGVTRVEYVMMSLEDKARFFEDVNRKRHDRYGLVSDSDFKAPGDPSTNVMGTNDNDGLWTSMYIAAECFRYGATGDPEAKKFARESLDSLMKLESVTGIPGFPARSFAKPDEPHCQGEWDHISADGKWRWKGDTSSDEIVGHFYGYSVYYDLCADDEEKKEIAAYTGRIMSHIVDNDYWLIDTDGKPTTFGIWNPEYFRREGRFIRGLNSLEILSHLETSIHITGDPKFVDAYNDLVKKHNYASYTVTQKLNQPYMINHSDDELAFLSYYPLLKYESHPFLLEYYNKSLNRSWRIERSERNPLWNFIYGALTPGNFDLEQAVWTLKHVPLTAVRWPHRNSQRADITIDHTKGRFADIQSIEPLPFEERTLHLWNENVFALDGAGNGANEQPGTFFLLPYWMGRYYGFIVESDSQ